jgi:hypothetical protein
MSPEYSLQYIVHDANLIGAGQRVQGLRGNWSAVPNCWAIVTSSDEEDLSIRPRLYLVQV